MVKRLKLPIEGVSYNKPSNVIEELKQYIREALTEQRKDIQNPIYSAIFFDKEEVLKKYKPVHPNVYSHHSTIEFRPQDISDLPIGKKMDVKVVGRITTDKVDTLIVSNPLSKNKYPHITLSTADGVKPFESNSEIENNKKKVKRVNDTLQGVVGVFDGKEDITEALKLDAPHKIIEPENLQDYITRVKKKEKTTVDKRNRPIVHASNVKAILKSNKRDENGNPIDVWDLEDLKQQIMRRPGGFLGKNTKMKKSDTVLGKNVKIQKTSGNFERVFDITLPALKGIVIDEETGDFVEVTTCPSAGTCKLFCYARKGGYIQFPASSMSASRYLNFLLNDPVEFSKSLNADIKANKRRADKKGDDLIVRWHDAGDFFSDDYLQLAYKIAEDNPDVLFYAYTKSSDIVLNKRPKNFIMNFSDGAHRRDLDKVKDSTDKGNKVKQALVVPKDLFDDLISKEGRKKVKDEKGRVQFKDNASLNLFKDRLSKEYKVDKKSIITYDQMLSKPEKGELRWNVIIPPGEGDKAAYRKDVNISFLLIH